MQFTHLSTRTASSRQFTGWHFFLLRCRLDISITTGKVLEVADRTFTTFTTTIGTHYSPPRINSKTHQIQRLWLLVGSTERSFELREMDISVRRGRRVSVVQVSRPSQHNCKIIGVYDHKTGAMYNCRGGWESIFYDLPQWIVFGGALVYGCFLVGGVATAILPHWAASMGVYLVVCLVVAVFSVWHNNSQSLLERFKMQVWNLLRQT